MPVPEAEGEHVEEARRWLVRLASGDMRGEELAAFKAWRAGDAAHDRAFVEQRALWRDAGPPPSVVPRDSSPDMAAAVRRRHPWRLAVTLAVAASLMWAVAMLPRLRGELRSGTSVRTVSLSDGTTAVLDAGTVIANRYDAGERRLELRRGSVWLDVSHGDLRPFRVAAGGGAVEDIGTAFAVHLDDDLVDVAVTEGRVKVTGAADGAPLLLERAGRAHFSETSPPVRDADVQVDDVAAWRHGELLFERVQVAQVLAALRRYRRAPLVVFGETPPLAINAVFRTDRVEEAIDSIAAMAGLTVYRFPANVVVLRRAE